MLSNSYVRSVAGTDLQGCCNMRRAYIPWGQQFVPWNLPTYTSTDSGVYLVLVVLGPLRPLPYLPLLWLFLPLPLCVVLPAWVTFGGIAVPRLLLGPPLDADWVGDRHVIKSSLYQYSV